MCWGGEGNGRRPKRRRGQVVALAVALFLGPSGWISTLHWSTFFCLFLFRFPSKAWWIFIWTVFLGAVGGLLFGHGLNDAMDSLEGGGEFLWPKTEGAAWQGSRAG